MNYCNLHTHSHFSTLDGAAKVEDLVKLAKEKGHTHLALTDHGSMAGSIHLKKNCQKYDIQPLYGCELFMIADIAKAQEGLYQQNLHLTAIAKNQKGFELMLAGLHHANTTGSAKKGRNKRAFLDPKYPLEHGWKDNVIILSGCANSPFWMLDDGKGIDLLMEYNEVFKEDLYLETMPLHDWEAQHSLNAVVLELAKDMDRKSVITNDIHYCKQEDHELHDLVLCFSQPGMTMNNPNRWKFSTQTNFFREAQDIINSMVKMGADERVAIKALSNTIEVAEKASFKLNPYPIELPKPGDYEDEDEHFFLECIEGLKKRNEKLIGDAVYWDRINKEIQIIVDKKFVRYFLIVADMITWAKKNGIFVGPGRGSVGGSLVAYAMGITELDPVKYGLPFERFVAPDRMDLPDIDIDIADKERGLVELYLKEKYGADCIAHVSTFNSLLGRMAIRDVCRALEINPVEADTAAKQIVKKVEGDPRFFNTVEDTRKSDKQFDAFCVQYPKVYEYASKLEGQIRNAGVHAAGLVLSPIPFKDSHRAYIVSNKDGQQAVNWDKDDVEFFGMVKIDLLGLSTHSVIANSIKLIKERTGKEIKLNELALDDPTVFKEISAGNTATMFQLSAPGTAAYCREMKPGTFEEIAAILALWRPGPIQSGMAKDYIEVKFGKKSALYLCDAHKQISETTRGQIIYQEQLTNLIMELAGFSYVEADKIRKIAAKKLGSDAWQAEGNKFIQGCIKKGTITEIVAQDLWNRLEGWAAYGFNAAHAYAYALVAYWSAWLKIYYPAEWMCSYLNYGSTERETKEGESNLDLALKEAGRMGLTILSPDINNSLDIWSVEESKILRAGLQEVRNIGEKTRIIIRQAQMNGKFHDFNNLMTRIDRRVVNSKAIKSLLYAGSLDNLPGEQWELWKSNFDEVYSSYDPERKEPSKKMLEALEKSKTIDLIVAPDEYLNYSGKAVGSFLSSIKIILDILGPGYKFIDDMIVQESDQTKWLTTDVYLGHLPGLKNPILKSTGLIKGLSEIKKNTIACEECDLHRTCNKPVPLDKGILNAMIIGESPGTNEDRYGKPLIGQSGELLFGLLNEMGFDREFFYIDNAVHCRPPKNALSNLEYIDKCPHLKYAIEKIKPKAMLCLGAKALYSLKKKESGIMKLNGTTEWNPEYECWITYCIHPNMVLMGKDNAFEMFKKGIVEFVRLITNLMGT